MVGKPMMLERIGSFAAVVLAGALATSAAVGGSETKSAADTELQAGNHLIKNHYMKSTWDAQVDKFRQGATGESAVPPADCAAGAEASCLASWPAGVEPLGDVPSASFDRNVEGAQPGANEGGAGGSMFGSGGTGGLGGDEGGLIFGNGGAGGPGGQQRK
jgi:hypothetical protein